MLVVAPNNQEESSPPSLLLSPSLPLASPIGGTQWEPAGAEKSEMQSSNLNITEQIVKIEPRSIRFITKWCLGPQEGAD